MKKTKTFQQSIKEKLLMEKNWKIFYLSSLVWFTFNTTFFFLYVEVFFLFDAGSFFVSLISRFGSEIVRGNFQLNEYRKCFDASCNSRKDYGAMQIFRMFFPSFFLALCNDVFGTLDEVSFVWTLIMVWNGARWQGSGVQGCPSKY